jgi:hypothetical protein
VRRRSATCSLNSARPPTRPLSNSASRPLRRLPPPPAHPKTGKRLQNKGPEPFTVLTINGRITLSRRRYFAKGVGSFNPLDTWIDSAEATISLGAREMACRLNLASRNFDKAAENLQRAAQFSLSGEFLRQVVEDEGKSVQKAAAAGQLPLGWDYRDCAAHDKDGNETGKTRVYLGSDGVKVPVVTQSEKDARRGKIKAKRRRRGKKCRKLPRPRAGADQRYKEFKIVTYYDELQEHRLVSVTRGDHEVAGRLMRRDGGRVGLDKADDKVALVDGAEWIKNQMEKQSLPLDDIGLDFYHLADYAHKTRRAVYGEEDPQDKTAPGNVWVAGILHTAKHKGYEALRDELVQWKATLRGRKQRQAAEALIGYVTDRREMIKYPQFQAVGRQIGSGPTESMCKATTLRIKGVGMRWDADNAEAIMALEALDQSGAWQSYWDSRLAQAA